MGDRFTFLLDDENAAWLEAEADERDRSRAWVLNECIRLARGENNTFEQAHDEISNDMHTDEESTSDERLDELEQRLGELEARIEGSPMPHERDARAEPGQAADGVTPDGPSPVESQNPSERAVSGSERSAIDDVLSEWVPKEEVNAERAREEAARAAEWLRKQGGRHKREEITNALADDSPLSERIWWTRAARAGLQELDDAGLVEYRSGYHDYKWTG